MEVKTKITKLEEECKLTEPGKLIFRGETRISEIYYCKASLTFLGKDIKSSVICPKTICRHMGNIHHIIKQDGSAEKDYGYYLCNYVPKKNNSQDK